MKIHYIESTDLISKAIAIAPTIQSKDDAPTVSSILNFFGDVKMRIHATLEPIELLYFLETHHNIKFDDDNSLTCDLDLSLGNIYYHVPQILFDMIYNGTPYVDILQNEVLCGLYAESLSNAARRRFATNNFIDTVTTNDGMFDGYTLNLIGVDGSNNMIAPITPSNRIQEEVQSLFEQELLDDVRFCMSVPSSPIYIAGVYTKKVTFQELRTLIASNISIDNITYSIRAMINDGIIPESMYSITKVKNLIGDERETIDFDFDGVNKLIESDALIPVAFRVVNEYEINSNIPSVVNDDTILHKYLDAIVNDNIQSIVDEYQSESLNKSSNDNNVVDNLDIPDANDIVESVDTLSTNINAAIKDFYNEKSDDTDTDSAFSLLQDAIELAEDNIQADIKNEETDDELPQSPGLLHYIDKYYPDYFAKDVDVNNDDNSVLECAESANNDASDNIHIQDKEFSFFVCNGTLDSISIIEKNEEFQIEGTKGIIAMDYENGVPTTYMIGTPVQYDIDEIGYKWENINYDSLFDDPIAAYRVHHWYNADGTINDNVILIDYRSHIENIGGDINVKTVI